MKICVCGNFFVPLQPQTIQAMLFITIFLLVVTMWSDSVLFEAYRKENMSVWKEYVDRSSDSERDLIYEYGFCGYMVAKAKESGEEAKLEEAKRRVAHFKSQITNHKSHLPVGHYEMFLSAVYVFELRLHESIHPVKAMSLAKEAAKLAPADPVVLSYYGTCLFYAPKPFGSKQEALRWFERAQKGFEAPAYRFHWMREANEMYIRQCQEKLQKAEK